MHHIRTAALVLVVVASIAIAAAAPAAAQDDGFDLGLRWSVLAGNGEPTNDVILYGLHGHVPLNDNWNIGFGIDHSPEFDVERSAKIIGFEQAGDGEDEIDQKGSSTTLTAWIEREYGRRLEWLWGVGAGIADIEVDSLAGFRANGAPFLIETDAGTELLVLGKVGLRYWFGERWAFSTEIDLEQHMSDWQLVEVRSGQSSTIDDYLLTGIRFGLSRRF